MNRINNITIKKTLEGKRYYKNIKYPNIPLSLDDIYIITTDGDRLDSLANQFYYNVELWWVIAAANPLKIRRDSYNLKPNLEIRIPSDINTIENNFRNLNK
tara:strand:- start:158 stop:460 length:303 start_codon:yes stop_codon:yes gene_type:complete